jgi:hypothetical protein
MSGIHDITLEADTVGIWLVGMTKEGAIKMGHVSWYEIYQHMKFQERREKALLNDTYSRIDA